jgi:glycosyltransferase involved in cell wall biosynthesis
MQPSLKIIHLSSSVEGGAGIAARRLNQGLIKRGIDSSLFTLSKTSISGELTIRRNVRSLIIGKINSYLAGMISNQTFFSVTSVNSLKIKKLRKIVKPGEGIIHIHNWFNLVSIKTIHKLASSGYKIVFTLHDQRMFTGGCHYALKCEQFKTSCSSCPELHSGFRTLPLRAHRQEFKLARKNSKSLVYVAPSRWIENEARNSSILADANIVYIQNTLDNFPDLIGISRPCDDVHGKLSKIKIGIASKDPNSYIKGGDLVHQLEQNSEICELFEFIYLVNFQVEQTNKFWLSIDILLVPSRIDNSPNVIHEAKSLGIPILGSNVGGIPELLTLESDILVEVDNLTSDFLIENYSRILSLTEKSRGLREDGSSFQQWSNDSLAKHIELYSSF